MGLETTASLTKRLGAVVSKRSGVALGLWGEPGVGKTFTVQRVLREIPCRSLTLHASASNLALVRALPTPKDLPVWAKRQVGLLEQGRHVESGALADALVAWLAVLSPFVLAIEDLHDASPERAGLWALLGAVVSRTRGVGMIVTSRVSPPDVFEAHQLEPLADRAARDLLESEAGSSLPPEAALWIEAHARGNPLFTLEYFRHLTRLGHLWSDGRRWRWRAPEDASVPLSVEAVIAHHLDAVSAVPATHRALIVKALLPLESDDALWAEISGLDSDALKRAKNGLERAGILRAGAFAHPLYREATRAASTQRERREIARRAVEVLAERDPIAAAGFAADADLGRVRARTLFERALERARNLGDAGLAARFMVQIAGISEPSSRVQTMLEAARFVREINLTDALGIAQDALALDASHLESILLNAELLAGLGRGEEAEHLLEPFTDSVESLQANAASRLLETRIRVKHLSHDYAGVLALWQESAQHPGSQVGMAVIARALVQLWRLEEAEILIGRTLENPNLSRLEVTELQYIRSIIPNYRGDYASAELGFSAFLRTLDDFEDGSPRFRELRAGTLQLRAYMRNVLGRPLEAVQDITQALAISASFGNAGYYAHVQSELGLYLLESGEYLRAEDAIIEARATLERVGNPIYLSVLERIAARLYLEWAPPHGAALSLKYARAALEYVDQAERPPFYTAGALFIAAWAEALHGRADMALGLVDQLDASATALGQVGVTAGAAWARGLALERLGKPEEAWRAIQQSLAENIPMRLGPSLDRMALELDRIGRDLTSATARAEGFRANGALGALHVARRYFPQLERRLDARAPAEASPRSQEVRLEVLGSTQVTVGGKPLSDRTRKGKELMAALCEARIAGRAQVADLELFDALYAGLTEDKAASALKQLVYRLRAALGSNAILRSNDGYALGAVETDAERFLETGDTQLWRGPYLLDLGAWVSNARDALHYGLRKRALELLAIDPAETARLGRILLTADPFDLEALEMSFEALREIGDLVALTRLRAWARAQFEDLGGVLPPTLEVR